MITVSFDFDETLVDHVSLGGWFSDDTIMVMRPEIVELLQEYHALGCNCVITTARSNSESNRREIESFLRNSKLDHLISKIIYTNFDLKGSYLYNAGVSLHYDDDLDHLLSAKEYGIKAISSIFRN